MAVVSKRSRNDDPVTASGLDEAVLRGMYRAMLLTRAIEERGHSLYRQGRIPGSFYTGRGNEAAAVGVAWAMAAQDVGCPTQRDLGVHVVRGMAPWRIIAQYLGRSEGPTRGRDGNVHLGDIHLGTLTMVSHLPAMLPVAVGCALAFRVRSEPRVALGWFGDGGSARGDAHEAMNLAGVRRLPMVFVLDNNGFAYSTPAHLEYGVAHLAERAAAYGFPGVVVDGTDVVAVHRAAQTAIERARSGGGPTLLELVTLRMEGHAVHDDAFYVPPELLEAWRERDPIALTRARLLAAAGGFDEAADEALRSEVAREVDVATELALASPWPDPATLTDGVYR
jgi:TPP-dependent pyruvate/acetoin dehydrogenase alpha subunit